MFVLARRLVINKIVLILSAAAAALAGFAPSALAYQWSWGYNYMGANVNQEEGSPYDYYYWETFLKNSGGTIRFGYGAQTPCYKDVTGQYDWSGSPSALGCGGYVNAFALWDSGATSYLKIYASA